MVEDIELYWEVALMVSLVSVLRHSTLPSHDWFVNTSQIHLMSGFSSDQNPPTWSATSNIVVHDEILPFQRRKKKCTVRLCFLIWQQLNVKMILMPPEIQVGLCLRQTTWGWSVQNM